MPLTYKVCPFAGRALILRELKGLQDIITISQTHWHKGACRTRCETD